MDTGKSHTDSGAGTPSPLLLALGGFSGTLSDSRHGSVKIRRLVGAGCEFSAPVVAPAGVWELLHLHLAHATKLPMVRSAWLRDGTSKVWDSFRVYVVGSVNVKEMRGKHCEWRHLRAEEECVDSGVIEVVRFVKTRRGGNNGRGRGVYFKVHAVHTTSRCPRGLGYCSRLHGRTRARIVYHLGSVFAFWGTNPSANWPAQIEFDIE